MSDFDKYSSLLPPSDVQERVTWLREQEERIANLVRRKLVALIVDATESFNRSLTASGDMSVFDSIPTQWSSWVDDVLLEELQGMYLAGGLLAYETSSASGILSDSVTNLWVEVVNQNAADYALTAQNRMKDVGMTAWNDIKNKVSKSIETGTSVEDLKTLLEKNRSFSEFRADTIARTETLNAYNNGNWEGNQALGEYGPTHKYWMATLDGRARETHVAVDNEVVPINEPFVVGGESMMYPHSPGASAKNVVNCRCTYGVLWPGDPHPVTGEPIPKPLAVTLTPVSPTLIVQPQTFTNTTDVMEFGRWQRQRGFTAEAFPDDLDAVVNYTNGSGWYSTINDTLRGSYVLRSSEVAKYERYVESLDKLMEASPKLEQPIVTYRGVKQGEFTDLLRTLNPGDEYVDAGFSSTSVGKSVAVNFAKDSGMILEIVNPVGTSGFMPLAFRTELTEQFASGELEWLLPRGSRFRVVSRSGNTVRVEVVL